MEFEELEQGRPEDDRRPAGPGRSAWILIATVCVLAGVAFLALRGPAEPEPAASTGPTAGPTIWSGGPVTGPVPYLTLGRICSAVVDRAGLSVSFTLVNRSEIDVTLTGLQPLPVTGLRPRRPTTAGGTCEDPGTEAPGGLLMPGSTQLVTLRFQPPPPCPHPHLEMSPLHLRVQQMVGTTTVATAADLGSVSVPTCTLDPRRPSASGVVGSA